MLPKRIPSPWLARLSLKRLQSTSAVASKLEETSNPNPPNTHYRITLLRSAIALPKRYRETLEALGIHRRLQTVYHAHTPDIAGKILRVKELVKVENVPTSAVRTKTEQRWERRPTPGFEIVGTWKDKW